MTPELHEYIRAHRAAGSSDEAIRAELVGAGWNEHDVAAALGNHLPSVPHAPTEAVAASGLPSFGSLLSTAWSTYQTNFRTLMAASLVPVAAFAVLGFIGGAGAAIASRLGLLNNPLTVVLAVVLAVAIGFFVVYISIWSQAAVLILIRDAAEQIGFKKAFEKASHVVWGFLGTALLVGLVTMGGFVLFIVPGIVFALWYTFATYVKIDEGIGGLSALVKSRHYVKGNLWGIFWRSCAFGLMIWVPYFILAIIAGVVTRVTHSHPFFAQIPLYIYQVLAAPLLTCFAYSVFRSVRATKAGSPEPTYSHGWITFWAIFGGILIPLMILSSVVLLALNSARVKARDAKRVADLRQITTAVMMYENDNGEFPSSLKQLEGQYLAEVPKAPIPPDVGCTVTSNEYRYKAIPAKSEDELPSFEIVGCLGGKAGTYGPGEVVATPEGIRTVTAPLQNHSPSNYQ